MTTLLRAGLVLLGFSVAVACSADPASTPKKNVPAVEREEPADPPPSDVPPAAGPRFDALIKTIESERIELKAPGVAVAILEKGQVTFARGFGSRHPTKNEPVKPTTLFHMGSCNKMLTAAGLLQLVASGKANLDAPVTQYVPAFKFSRDPTWAPSIKLRHLLAHTSGMYDYGELDVPAAQKEDGALEAFVTGEFGTIDYLMYPAGRMFNYSNPNYMVAGLVAEKLSGKPYRTFMKESLLDPLGMKRTFFLPAEAIADGDYASGLVASPGAPEDGATLAPDAYDNGWLRPAGYAYSSVLDMAEFVKFLRAGNEKVLPKALLDAMQSPQVTVDEFLDLEDYGYGLEISAGMSGSDGFRPMRVVHHSGALAGASASLYYIPSLDFGWLTLANTDGAYFPKSLEAAVKTLTAAPAPIDVDPKISPAKFPEYVGTYEDPYGVGDIIVAMDGADLSVTFPALDAEQVPYDKKLAPFADRQFGLEVAGELMAATIVLSPSGKAEYFRTRGFVGRKAVQGLLPRSRMAHPDRARLMDLVRQARHPLPLSRGR